MYRDEVASEGLTTLIHSRISLYESKSLYKNCGFLLPHFADMHVQNKKYGNFVFVSRLTGKCATH